jgi:hypothetical protein
MQVEAARLLVAHKRSKRTRRRKAEWD